MKLLSAAAAISACLLMSGNIMAQNIQIKVDDKAFTGELNNNDAAKDFAANVNFQRFPTLDAKKLVNAPKMSAHHRGICHF